MGAAGGRPRQCRALLASVPPDRVGGYASPPVPRGRLAAHGTAAHSLAAVVVPRAGRSSQSAASVYSHPPASRHGSCSRATQTAAVRGIAGRERMANRPDQGYIWARSMYRLRRKGCQLSTILRSYWLDKLALRHIIGQLRCALAHMHIRQIWDNSNSINVQGPGEHWLATSPSSTQPDTTCYTKVVNFQSRL